MRILPFILLIFILSSCQKTKVEEISFEKEIEKRYQLFLKKEENKCRLNAESVADRYVDSLIDKWIKKELIDTINFPSKPNRPDRPDKIIN